MSRKVLMKIVYGGLICATLLLALLIFIGTLPGEVTVKTHATSDSPQATKILFIGNSMTYTEDAPTQFVKIYSLIYGAQPLLVKSATGPGLTLREHLANKNTKKALQDQKWDYVIVQEGSQPAFHRPEEALESIRRIVKITQEDGGKPFVVMIPADRGRPEWQTKLNVFFRKTANELAIPLVPLGEVCAFCQKYHPELNLHNPDKHHPNKTGALLYACLTARAVKPFETATLKDKLSKAQSAKQSELTAEQLKSLAALADVLQEWDKENTH